MGRRFWDLIGALRDVPPNDYAAAESWFRSRSSQDLVLLWEGLRNRLDESYRWDVWAVGAIAGGMLDLDFLPDYQVWLVLHGREFFERVLGDPARAADDFRWTEPATHFLTPALHAADRVQRERTGRELPELRSRLRTPRGARWIWQDLERLQPDLWRSYFVERDRRPRRPDLDRIADGDLVWCVRTPLSWVDIYDGPEYYDAQCALLTTPQRAVHAVTWMESEVMNGGIGQFFWNPTGIVAADALRGLELIGAHDLARYLAAVMAEFPGGRPSPDREERVRQMEERWRDTIEAEFAYPRDASELIPLVARYIREHPAEFFRPD